MFYEINGSIIEEDQAKISIQDRGFLFGDGLFETIAMRQGRMSGFDKHIERINRSARILGIRHRFQQQAVLDAVRRLIDKNGLQDADVNIKIILTRGQQTGSIAFSDAKGPLHAILVKRLVPYAQRWYREGMPLAVSSIRRVHTNPVLGHKMLNYFENVYAKEEAMGRGAQEALFLSTDGKVLESAMANVFAVQNGKVWTPPPEGILAGITRGLVLSLCKEARLPASESVMDMQDLLAADGVFLTNSIMDVMPVCSIDGCRIGDGSPCRTTRKIMELFAQER